MDAAEYAQLCDLIDEGAALLATCAHFDLADAPPDVRRAVASQMRIFNVTDLNNPWLRVQLAQTVAGMKAAAREAIGMSDGNV